MRLICNDIDQVYVWVNDLDEEVSPHFDYEEDAIQWHINTFKKVPNKISFDKG